MRLVVVVPAFGMKFVWLKRRSPGLGVRRRCGNQARVAGFHMPITERGIRLCMGPILWPLHSGPTEASNHAQPKVDFDTIPDGDHVGWDQYTRLGQCQIIGRVASHAIIGRAAQSQKTISHHGSAEGTPKSEGSPKPVVRVRTRELADKKSRRAFIGCTVLYPAAIWRQISFPAFCTSIAPHPILFKLVHVKSECGADLLEIAFAHGGSGRSLCPVQLGKQQGRKHGDDRNHHQKFDQRECRSSTSTVYQTALFAAHFSWTSGWFPSHRNERSQPSQSALSIVFMVHRREPCRIWLMRPW